MLADLKAKKYCLHPGRLLVVVMGRDSRGEPTETPLKAWKYFSAQDLAKAYGVDLELCITWGRDCVGVDHLIHLAPDREGRYELPVMEAPVRSHRESKGKR